MNIKAPKAKARDLQRAEQGRTRSLMDCPKIDGLFGKYVRGFRFSVATESFASEWKRLPECSVKFVPRT